MYIPPTYAMCMKCACMLGSILVHCKLEEKKRTNK